jgi:hypothetical protein
LAIRIESLKTGHLTNPSVKQADPGRKKHINFSEEKRMEVREIVYFEKTGTAKYRPDGGNHQKVNIKELTTIDSVRRAFLE